MKPSNGKISRLPRALRDQINSMIRDSVPYNTIIQTLGEPVRHINEDNFTNWKQNGYQAWLREQERIEHLQKISSLASEAAKSNEPTAVHQATLDLIGAQIFEALADFDIKSLSDALNGDAQNYPRLVNALARLSQGSLRYEHYRALVAKQKAIIAKELDAAEEGGLTPDAIAKMHHALNLM